MTTIARLCTRMTTAQTRAHALLEGFEGRAMGLRTNMPAEAGAWHIGWDPNPQRGLYCTHRLVWRVSAHARLARGVVEAALIDTIADLAPLLGASAPVLADTPFSLILPMAGDGTLGPPYWRIGGYPMRAMLGGARPERTPLAGLLGDLAVLPAPAHTYTIGNKTMSAASPEAALAFHLRMSAPKTPTARRKPPAYIPAIHRIWSPAEASVMAGRITEAWRGQTPASLR